MPDQGERCDKYVRSLSPLLAHVRFGLTPARRARRSVATNLLAEGGVASGIVAIELPWYELKRSVWTE
jgi:hypothetical protein